MTRFLLEVCLKPEATEGAQNQEKEKTMREIMVLGVMVSLLTGKLYTAGGSQFLTVEAIK